MKNKFSKIELLIKFPFLEKYQDSFWIEEKTISGGKSVKEIPLEIARISIKNAMEFLESTKFSNRWEENFSTKIRLKQILDLLDYFLEPDIKEKTMEKNFS